MRVLITGASSFVGAHVARVLAPQVEVLALHHHTPLALPGVRAVRADLGAPEAEGVLGALRPDAVVHLACKVMGTGDGRRFTPAMALNRRMMDQVLGLGCPVVYGSSTCVGWPVDSGYAQGRREDEDRLARSGLPWLSLRPCAPFGPRLAGHQPRHKESFHTLAEWVARSPVVPMLGWGRALRQPIHVLDFGAAVLAALDRLGAGRGLPRRALDAGGAQALAMGELVVGLARLRGRRVLAVPVPARGMAALGRVMPGFEPALLRAADTPDLADPGPLTAALGVRPRGFWDGAPDLWREV